MDSSTPNIGFEQKPLNESKGKKGKLLILIIIALLIGGGIFMAVRNSQKSQDVEEESVIEPTEEELPTEEPTEEPEETPTPTKKATPTPSPIPTTGAITSAFDMNVEVLNGSGTAGVAGEGATFLSDKGYKNVTTGNADNFDFTGVTVKVKSSRSQFLSTLVNHLKEKYTVSASSSDLPDSAGVDAQVIIGK